SGKAACSAARRPLDYSAGRPRRSGSAASRLSVETSMIYSLRLSFASLAVAALVLLGCGSGSGRAPADKDSESPLIGRRAPDRKAGKTIQVGRVDKGQLVGGLTPQKEQDMLKDFARWHKLEHPLLVVNDDVWRKAEKDYDIEGIPTLVLIDRQGVVRMVRVGA